MKAFSTAIDIQKELEMLRWIASDYKRNSFDRMIARYKIYLILKEEEYNDIYDCSEMD